MTGNGLVSAGNGIISTSAEERKAFFGEGTESSEEEDSDDEDLDFLSNAEFFGARGGQEM